MQTVCLRLWQSPDPEALLADKGVQGLLEDELGEALDAFPTDVRAAAIALLGQMVTSAGTRNVISAEDLHQRVRDEDEEIPSRLLDDALERLERRVQARPPRTTPRPLPVRDHQRVPRAMDQPPTRGAAPRP